MTLKFNLLKLTFVKMGIYIRVWWSGDFLVLFYHVGSRAHISYCDFFPVAQDDIELRYPPDHHAWLELLLLVCVKSQSEAECGVIHSLQPNTQEADTGRLLGLRSAWFT